MSVSGLTFADGADGKAARHDAAVWSLPDQNEAGGCQGLFTPR